MAIRRAAIHVAMLAALVLAPSAVSAKTPHPRTVMVDASPEPGASTEPVTALTTPPAEPAPTLAPAPRPTATPRPSAAPAPTQRAIALVADNEAPRRPDPDRPRGRDRTRPRPNRTNTGAPSPTLDAAPSSRPIVASPPAADRTPPDPGIPLPLLWTIAAVGGIALLGTAWLLVARRRDPAPAVGIVRPADALGARGRAGIEGRATRRARLRQDDDPILAGLGLDEDASRAASPRSRPGGQRRP